MPGNPDPVEQIAGLGSGGTSLADVSKTDFVGFAKADLHCFADCATVRNIDLSGRTRIMAGNRFFRIDTSDTSSDDATESTPTIIDAAGNHWLVLEGDRYDLPFPTTGELGDGEALFAINNVPPIIIPADMPGSTIKALDGVPTSDATFTFKYTLDNGATWVTAFTGTILAGARTGTFTLAADLSLPAGASLRPYAPNPHDPTLDGFTATIAALR